MQEILTEYATNVNVLTAVIALLGVLCSAIAATSLGVRIQDWWERMKNARYGAALGFLEVGVIAGFNAVYAQLKAKNGGHISAEDGARLRRGAIEAAVKASYNKLGKDIVIPTIGEDQLDAEIERIIDDIKSRTHVPIPKVLAPTDPGAERNSIDGH